MKAGEEIQELSAYTKLGGRKFIFALVVLAVTSILVCFGVITAPLYQAIVLADMAGYFTANVWQKSFTSGGTS